MLKRTVQQLLYFCFILLGVSFFTFGLSQFIPGDPAEILLRGSQEAPSQEQIHALQRDLGLDRPFFLRYFSWLGRALKGDLGRSWKTGQPVLKEITDHLPATLELTFFTFILVVLVSSLIGFFSALGQDKALDRMSGIFSVTFLSLPNFWLGTLLIYFLGLKLGWLPVLGRGGFSHLVLPVLTLGLPVASLQSRVLRARILDLLGQEYIRFARAKGLPLGTIVKNHLIRNALPPLISLWGLTLGSLLGGAYVVESLFSWPGLGRLTVEAVLSRDQPLVQGTVLFMAFCYAVINQGVDWIHKALDPRLRAEAFRPEEGGF